MVSKRDPKISKFGVDAASIKINECEGFRSARIASSDVIQWNERDINKTSRTANQKKKIISRKNTLARQGC